MCHVFISTKTSPFTSKWTPVRPKSTFCFGPVSPDLRKRRPRMGDRDGDGGDYRARTQERCQSTPRSRIDTSFSGHSDAPEWTTRDPRLYYVRLSHVYTGDLFLPGLP